MKKIKIITVAAVLIFLFILLAGRFLDPSVKDFTRNIELMRYRGSVEVCAEEKPRFNCWEEVFTRILEEEGIKEAVWFLDRLRGLDPVLASNCHDHAHLVGEISYWKFELNGDIDLEEDTTLCEYGFFHGFMQEYGHHGKGFLENATEVCDILLENFSTEQAIWDTSNQCYHGIGHGLVYHYINEVGEDDEKVLSKAIPKCSEILPGNEKECAEGVYGGINLVYFGYHGYKIPIREEDPYWICHSQPEAYRRGCYTNISPSIFSFYSRDFTKALASLDSLEDPSYLSSAIEGLASASSHHFYWEPDFYSEAVDICKNLKEGFTDDCFTGLAQGIINRSSPQEGYELAIDLCQKKELEDEDKKVCIEGVLNRARHSDPELLPEVCNLVGEKYRKDCEG